MTGSVRLKFIALVAVLFTPLAGSLEVQAQQSQDAPRILLPVAERRGYITEFRAALPAGTTYETASAEDFAAAVQRVILAHPANQAPAIAYSITSLVGLERAREVAMAIAALFEAHPDLRNSVADIARAMVDALRARVGDTAQVAELNPDDAIIPLGDSEVIEELVNEAIGEVLSVFSDYLGTFGVHLLPRGSQPGEIISHETPIINL